MPSSISPNTSRHFPEAAHANRFQKKLTSFVAFGQRKDCLIKISIILPTSLLSEALSCTVHTVKFVLATLLIGNSYGPINKTVSNFYWKTFVNFGKSLLRLALLIVQTVGYLFGYSCGLFIHPCIAKWVEKNVDKLNRFKFRSLPGNITTFLIDSQGMNNKLLFSFTGSDFVYEEPPVPPKKPEKEPEGEFYVPDFADEEDYYRILGIHPNDLTKKSLNLRFKKLAPIYHPDKPTGDTNRFQMLSNAKDMLEKKLESIGIRYTTSFTSNRPTPASRTKIIRSVENPPAIPIPSSDLPADAFIQAFQKTLLEICMYSQIPSVLYEEDIQPKHQELRKAYEAFVSKNGGLSKPFARQLHELKDLVDFHETLQKEFALSSSTMCLGTMAPGILKKLSQDLIQAKPAFLKNFKCLPSNPHLVLIHILLGYRYYEKLAALHLAEAKYHLGTKNKFRAYYAIRAYRQNAAEGFFKFNKFVVDSTALQNAFEKSTTKDFTDIHPFYSLFAKFLLPKQIIHTRTISNLMLKRSDFVKLLLSSKIFL